MASKPPRSDPFVYLLPILLALVACSSPPDNGGATGPESGAAPAADTSSADTPADTPADPLATNEDFALKISLEGILAFVPTRNGNQVTQLRALAVNASGNGARPRPNGSNLRAHRAALVFEKRLLAEDCDCQTEQGPPKSPEPKEYRVENLYLPNGPNGNGHAISWTVDGQCDSTALDTSEYDHLARLEDFGQGWGELSDELQANIENPRYVVAHATLSTGKVSTVESRFEDPNGRPGQVLRWSFGNPPDTRPIAEELLLEDTCRGSGVEIVLSPYGDPSGERRFRLEPEGSEVAFRIVNLLPSDIPVDDRSSPRLTSTIKHFSWFYILSKNHGGSGGLPKVPELSEEQKELLPPEGGWPVCALAEMEPTGP